MTTVYIYGLKKGKDVFYVGRTKDIVKRKSDYKMKVHDKSFHLYNSELYKYLRANKYKLIVLDRMEVKSDEDFKEFKRMERSYIQVFNPKMNTHRKIK